MTQRQSVSRRGVLLGGAGLAAAGMSRRVPGARSLAHRPDALSAQQLAGQRVIFSYPGLTPPNSLLQQISAGEAAGVIFFGGNISGESQIASVIAQLNAANASSPVQAPLLLMTDQEGGEVRRLPGAPAQSEKQIGESGDPAGAASQAGTGAGQNLAGVGMNVNLAPVLDVYRQAGDFDDQYQRSYSMDPTVVSECGRAFITAQQATGVAAAAKHFPGLGAATASQDTDTEPVTLNVSLSDLRGIDEFPYPAAISAGIKLVMVSWAIYPALDAGNPAGLSATIVQQELRTRLGFTGVTITDALEAGAISSFGSYGELGVLAAQAGMDLLLASAQDVSEGQDAVSGLATALGNGTLSQSGFTAAVNRVSALRASLG
ncbi:MAG: glycoside hydrolase family 3 N-terminal domain-containing protein [Trebonia sp.]